MRAIDKALPPRPEGKVFCGCSWRGPPHQVARGRSARLSAVRGRAERDSYELEVIDVYQQPELARDNQIIATPTLIKEFPRPVRRFIGNLMNTDRPVRRGRTCRETGKFAS
jgi:hypothetical protein